MGLTPESCHSGLSPWQGQLVRASREAISGSALTAHHPEGRSSELRAGGLQAVAAEKS